MRRQPQPSHGHRFRRQSRFSNPGTEQTWRICFHPSPGLLACGGNPLLLFRDLAKLGPCEIEVHTEDVPPLNAIQPDLCYFWWTITLQSTADENAIRDVFLFVADGNNLEIEMCQSAPADSAVAGTQPEPMSRGRKPKPDGQPRKDGMGRRWSRNPPSVSLPNGSTAL